MEYETYNKQPNEVIEKLIEYIIEDKKDYWKKLNSTLYFPELHEFWFLWHSGMIEKYKVTDDEFKDIKRFWDKEVMGKCKKKD